MRRAIVALRIVVGLVAASSLIGGPTGTAVPATAQTPTRLAGIQGRALASGVAASYKPEGLLPIASPVDLSSPDALATIASGPSTFARASVADPGDLLANPDALLALGIPDWQAGTIPPYPYRVSASSGVGAPTAESTPAPGLGARVAVTAGGSTADATMPFIAAPAVATAGSIASHASTVTDGATVTVHARTEVSEFNLLGVLTIDSVVTDVTATSDGVDTSVSGGTIITGASVAGQPVTIDAGGVHTEPQSQQAPSVLADVIGSGGGSLDEVLAGAGISVTLVSPVVQDGETSGQLTSAGLRIVLEVSETTMPLLGQLADLVPPNDVPGVEDLVALAHVRHLQYIEVGRGAVTLTARPGRSTSTVTPARSALPPTASAGSMVGASSPTRVPTAAAAPASAVAGPAIAAPAATEPTSRTTLAAGVGALAFLALLAQPFAGNLLARFAGAQLAPGAAGSCAREGR